MKKHFFAVIMACTYVFGPVNATNSFGFPTPKKLPAGWEYWVYNVSAPTAKLLKKKGLYGDDPATIVFLLRCEKKSGLLNFHEKEKSIVEKFGWMGAAQILEKIVEGSYLETTIHTEGLLS